MSSTGAKSKVATTPKTAKHNSGHPSKGQLVDDHTPEIMPDEIEYGERIGEGCYGEVWRGKCRGGEVAIKKLLKQELDPKTLADFKKEVEIMSRNHHPNVVLFMGACTQPGSMCMVSELMKHGSVHDLIHKPDVEISVRQRLKMLKDTALGMNWLHCSDPAIIHRDLKPSNLLIDANWNVKVCDFGLSLIHPRGVTFKDEDRIPGTPLWMAPEVMMGKDLDEKTDVYSFGIVMWEVLTRDHPFQHHNDYETFKQAICVKHERPPLNRETTHACLIDLMERSWEHDPKVRPNFGEITRMLDECLVECLVADELGISFWKQNFLGKDTIAWSELVGPLCKLLGVPVPKPNEASISFKCLQRILAEENKDPAINGELVGLERWGHCLNWFGPLEPASKGRPLLPNRVEALMKQQWFHGEISSADAEAMLSQQKSGTWLVRLSTKDAKEPFTISKVSKKGPINHQRVRYRPSDRTYSLTIKFKNKEKYVESKPGDGLDVFIREIKKDLYLQTAAPATKYAALFVAPDSEGYLRC